MVSKPLTWINCGGRLGTRPSSTAQVMAKIASEIRIKYFFMCFPVMGKRQDDYMHNNETLLSHSGQ